jgi:hypothetical protein
MIIAGMWKAKHSGVVVLSGFYRVEGSWIGARAHGASEGTRPNLKHRGGVLGCK